jgi:predicted porin
MKKSLLALAAMGAFTGAAQAQSSVTVSGALEAGYTSKSIRALGSTTTDVSQNQIAGGASLSGGHAITPQITFSGTEDLGGGMRASFFIQEEFDPSTGTTETSGSTTSLSQTFVSLSSNQFGTVSVGRMNHATRDLGGVYRFFGDIGRLASPMNSGNNVTNTVQYVSPTFQGFNVSVANSSAGKTYSTILGADTNVSPAGLMSFGLSGKIGKGAIAAAREETTYAAASAGADNAKAVLLSVGGNYDFGVAKLGAAYVAQTLTLAGGSDGGKRNAYTFNLAAPVAKNITVGASYASYEITPATANAAKPKADIMTLVGQYAFSKRTSIYASYQQVKNSGADDALRGVHANGTGINNSATGVGGSRGLNVVEINGGTGSGYGLTVVHTF